MATKFRLGEGQKNSHAPTAKYNLRKETKQFPVLHVRHYITQVVGKKTKGVQLLVAQNNIMKHKKRTRVMYT